MLGIITTCLLVAAVAWLWSAVHTWRAKNAVPVVPGVPLLGSMVALGRGGTAFITQCRQQFGDVFCVRVLHQRMVFVFDPSMLSVFFKAPESEISFKPAVKQFTQRVYGLPSSEFFDRHEPLLTTLRQLLVPANLETMGHQLLTYAQPQLQQWKQQGKIELWKACQNLVFRSAGRVLFGEAFFARHGLEYVQTTFLQFEENFEIAASPVPHLFLPTFRRSRRQLLHMFRTSLAAGDFAGTVVEKLLSGCGMKQQYWPNLLLAVLWASQANSMPALYWSLAFLLLPEQAHVQQQILQALQESVQQQKQQQLQQREQNVSAGNGACLQEKHSQVVDGIDAATAAAMLQLAMDKNSFVSRCVAEAVRLRLHSIAVRFVATDNLSLSACNLSSSRQDIQHRQPQQQEYHVQPGSILCICPIESHHDERLFPDGPHRFNPGRSMVQGLQPGTVVPSIAGMGYGGGYWRCPGRFFAEMELALLLQLVLLQLQLDPELKGGSARQHSCADKSAGVTCNRSSTLYSMLPKSMRDMLVFGLGMFDGCQQQAEQWRCSGDPQQLLAPCNLMRLVGFKVPQESWWLKIAGAST